MSEAYFTASLPVERSRHGHGMALGLHFVVLAAVSGKPEASSGTWRVGLIQRSLGPIGCHLPTGGSAWRGFFIVTSGIGLERRVNQ